MIKKIKTVIIRKIRSFYLHIKSIGFKNKSVSIICNNCIGGAYYRCLRNKFNSPLINLNIPQEDFPFFVTHLKEYMSLNIVEITSIESYPVGIFDVSGTNLKPIKIEFIHYHCFNEAKSKWVERSKRINYGNIRVIFDITSRQDLEKQYFDELEAIKYKKIVLTGGEPIRPYYYKIDFLNRKFKNGRLFEWYHIFKRFYDQFDYKSFLN